MERITRFRWIMAAVIVLVMSGLLAIDFSRVDDVPYHKILDEGVLSAEGFQDSESELDSIADGMLSIEPGEGLKLFFGEVNLTEGDSFQVSFAVENRSTIGANLTIDLYAPDFNDAYNRVVIPVFPGRTEVLKEVPFSRQEHPDSCQLRIYSSEAAEMVIQDIGVDRLAETRGGHPLVRRAVLCMLVLCGLAAAYIMMCVVYHIANPGRIPNAPTGEIRRLDGRGVAVYATVIILVTLTLLIVYRRANITYPLLYYGTDEMGVYYYAKNIRENGISLVNAQVGGITGGDMFDYPYSDKYSFILVRAIGFFVSNPYLIINIFYFSQFYIIALVTVAVCRSLGLKPAPSVMVGLLYAFSPFIQMRYNHMWLIPYFTIPLACMLAMQIIQGKVVKATQPEERRSLFWKGMLIAFICSSTGLYYAFFTCALLASAMVIRLVVLRFKRVSRECYPVAYILSTILGVILNATPNLLYWSINGANPESELAQRGGGSTEVYGLKLVQMLLPRTGHRVGRLNAITAGYNAGYPLVNENMSAALGIVAGVGLVLSIVFLFAGWKKYREVASLNLATFLIAVTGGIGTIISVFVAIPMRCYNRMSLVIMFLSLFLIGMLLSNVDRRGKRMLCLVLCGCLTFVGLYDQTSDFYPPDYSDFESTRNLMGEVQQVLTPGDMVFTLPYDNWPTPTIGVSYRQYIPYLETDGICWSYGAMQGREEARWQQAVAECDAQSMISKLVYAGYDGIYFDAGLYAMKYGEEKAQEDANSITSALGYQPMVSEKGTAYFWQIGK